jgi:hypothetical protein
MMPRTAPSPDAVTVRPAGRRLSLDAVLLHLGIRTVVFAAIAVAVAIHRPGSGSYGGDLGGALGKSDGVWYLGIAHHGYGPLPPTGADGSYVSRTSLAFFPLYPMLIRAVHVTGIPYLGAALVVTALAGMVAAVAIAHWTARIAGRRTAIALLVGWELLPASVVLNMAYSEPLFLAAAAGCLLAIQRQRWLVAGVIAGIGGLTRPTGGGLVLALAVAGGVAFWRERRQAPEDPGPRRRVGLAVVAGVVVGAAGLIASLAHVAVRTHRWDGWFWLERTAWHSGLDWGRATPATIGRLLSGGDPTRRLPEAVAVLTVIGVLVLAVWALRRRPRIDAGAAAYTAAAAVLAIGERNYVYVKPRLLFVCFPALLPFASWLTERSRRTVVAVGVPVAVLSVAYNTYLLVGWPRAL